MTTTLQKDIIKFFNNNKLMRESRENKSLYEKRFLLHKQFLFFWNNYCSILDYKNVNYLKALELYDILHLLDVELAVKSTVHFNLWGETVSRLGTEKHREYLDKTEKREIFGCFAMTEIGHGSNVMSLETTATYHPIQKKFIINSPSESSFKYWIGGAAEFAHFAVVFAQLYVKNEHKGVHPFIVPLRNVDTNQYYKGITIKDCGNKKGLNSIDNGCISFNNVEIPYDNLLDRYAQIININEYKTEKGRFSKMMAELSKNRYGMGTGTNLVSRYILNNTLQYSINRKQFGSKNNETPIINYFTHQERLFPLLCKLILLKIYTNDTLKIINNKFLFHIPSIISKINGTNHCLETLQQCREACGGQGYHYNTRIGYYQKHLDIYATFEGDNNVLLQQIFQSYSKILRNKMNIKYILKYKLSKYFNQYLCSLKNNIRYDGKINILGFVKTLKEIIDFKTTNILLYFADAEQTDFFNIWKEKLDKIIEVSKMISDLYILESCHHTSDPFIINLIKLFIINHIKENIRTYINFIPKNIISKLDIFKKNIYNFILKNIKYYRFLLDIPNIEYLNETNQLNKIIAKL